MYVFLLVLSSLLAIFPRFSSAQWGNTAWLQLDTVGINTIASPTVGEAVQGSVVIRGSINPDGFLSYEVDFSYSNDGTNTWFMVQESNSPVQEGVLAIWDTTTISDGEYSLLLAVNKTDGTSDEVVINKLRVRNYTPIETETPAPSQPARVQTTQLASTTPKPETVDAITTTSALYSPTPLPTNPAEISAEKMVITLGKGVGITFGLFAILGIYIGLRTMANHRR
jgi:hypothetical protein